MKSLCLYIACSTDVVWYIYIYIYIYTIAFPKGIVFTVRFSSKFSIYIYIYLWGFCFLTGNKIYISLPATFVHWTRCHTSLSSLLCLAVTNSSSYTVWVTKFSLSFPSCLVFPCLKCWLTGWWLQCPSCCSVLWCIWRCKLTGWQLQCTLSACALGFVRPWNEIFSEYCAPLSCGV